MEDNQFIDYYEVSIKHSTLEEAEINLALLQQYDFFESFVEQPDTLLAYVPANLYAAQSVQEAVSQLPGTPVAKIQRVPRENWNVFWEQHYSAVEIDSFCFIHPDFIEPAANFRYNIRIQPKMSFGTGHHSTTRLIIRLLQNFNCSGKKIADIGCGTGILGILAAKMGASVVSLVDIDPWCVENAQENALTNQISATVQLGTAAQLMLEQPFNLVFANITRNILLAEAAAYRSLLQKSGTIMLSGFYEADVPLLLEKYRLLGFSLSAKLVENNWAALQLTLGEV